MNSKSRTAALVAALAAALGSLVLFPGPAQAYDSRSCFAALPVPVTDIDQFKMKSGSVDFGDGWHLGGSPLGDAVVCWGGGTGYIAIIGKVYADSPTLITTGVDVRYFRTDGSYSTSSRVYFSGSNGESSSPLQFAMPGGTAVDRVRIRLWRCWLTGSGGLDCNLSNAETFHRGDVNIQ
ncbi:MAG: hypothetical protein ACRDWY_17425 [Actinomycetes bacterium]